MHEEANQKLLSLVPCGIITFTDKGIIEYINEPLLEKLEYGLEELSGKSIETILTLSSRIFYQTHFFPLLKLKRTVNEIYLTLLTRDKKSVPVLLNATLTVEGGREINICACITVYERKKYEDEILQAKRVAEETVNKNEELQHTKKELEFERERLDRQVTSLKNKNRELSQFNDLFAHDLQEPVRKVSLFADIIMNDRTRLFKGNPDSLFNIIHRSAQKMQGLLRGLQDYLYLNVEQVERKPVNLNKVLEHEIEQIKQKHPEVQTTVELDTFPTIDGSPSQLAILFKELLKNSFCFRRGNALAIKIGCTVIEENVYNNSGSKYRYDEFLRINFEDDGLGIRAETREHIFKILKKGDNVSEGLGMGLALCKKIVENHEGTILAANKSNGSKFVVTLPLR